MNALTHHDALMTHPGASASWHDAVCQDVCHLSDRYLKGNDALTLTHSQISNHKKENYKSPAKERVEGNRDIKCSAGTKTVCHCVMSEVPKLCNNTVRERGF